MVSHIWRRRRVGQLLLALVLSARSQSQGGRDRVRQTRGPCHPSRLARHLADRENRLRCFRTMEGECRHQGPRIPTSEGPQANTRVLGDLVGQKTKCAVGADLGLETTRVDPHLLLQIQTRHRCQTSDKSVPWSRAFGRDQAAIV